MLFFSVSKSSLTFLDFQLFIRRPRSHYVIDCFLWWANHASSTSNDFLPKYFLPKLNLESTKQSVEDEFLTWYFRAEEVKQHAFFAGMDWHQVYVQKYTPPLIPPRGEVNAADAFDIGSFDEEDTKGIKVSSPDFMSMQLKLNYLNEDFWISIWHWEAGWNSWKFLTTDQLEWN